MNNLTINSVTFQCPQDETGIYVPIRPVCEALGIAHQPQQDLIKNHPIIGSTVTLRVTVGGDKKDREMTCIPLKYAFGWILGIDARKVKPEAYEAVIDYQKLAYEALYDRFFLEPVMQKQKLLSVLEKEAEIKMAEAEKRLIGEKIKDMKRELEELKESDPRQLKLFNNDQI